MELQDSNKETIDTMFISRYLNSKEFNITTKSMLMLEKTMINWVSLSVRGAMVYGFPRIGKTRAITHLIKTFSSPSWDGIPVLRWNITDHKPTEKQFYSSFIKVAMHLPEPKRFETALTLKNRIINTLVSLSRNTKYQMIILFIDEASELCLPDFAWIMDLYNSLEQYDIMLMVYMFGTYKLKALKQMLRANGESQIIERFMAKEYVYEGVCDEESLMQCLVAMDQPMDIAGETVKLEEVYFPDAYADGRFFSSDLTHSFWCAFNKVKIDHGIPKESAMPMQYFLTAFINLLVNHGKGGSAEKYFPEQKDIELCLIESGMLEMEYHKNGKGRRK